MHREALSQTALCPPPPSYCSLLSLGSPLSPPPLRGMRPFTEERSLLKPPRAGPNGRAPPEPAFGGSEGKRKKKSRLPMGCHREACPRRAGALMSPPHPGVRRLPPPREQTRQERRRLVTAGRPDGLVLVSRRRPGCDSGLCGDPAGQEGEGCWAGAHAGGLHTQQGMGNVPTPLPGCRPTLLCTGRLRFGGPLIKGPTTLTPTPHVGFPPHL